MFDVIITVQKESGNYLYGLSVTAQRCSGAQPVNPLHSGEILGVFNDARPLPLRFRLYCCATGAVRSLAAISFRTGNGGDALSAGFGQLTMESFRCYVVPDIRAAMELD